MIARRLTGRSPASSVAVDSLPARRATTSRRVGSDSAAKDGVEAVVVAGDARAGDLRQSSLCIG